MQKKKEKCSLQQKMQEISISVSFTLKIKTVIDSTTYLQFKTVLSLQNRGELKKMRITTDAWFDHRFWRWSMWFIFNSLWPGRAMRKLLNLLSCVLCILVYAPHIF